MSSLKQWYEAIPEDVRNKELHFEFGNKSYPVDTCNQTDTSISFIGETPFSPEDIFLLGQAWISFRMGEIDQAIHLTIPGIRLETVRPSEEISGRMNIRDQFRSLHEAYTPILDEMNNPTPENDPSEDETGDVYRWFADRLAVILLTWCIERGLNLQELLERTKVTL